jgi:O-antigen ligase
MDWIFACILQHLHPDLPKVISYDIVCQWWINLKDHLKKLPPMLCLVLVMSLMRFVIPKMHIHSHTLLCQLFFSLNLVPGSAQTDGEEIERPWAHIGA